MANNATMFLVDARQESGNVFEGDYRDIKTVTEAHEASAFDAGIDIENSRKISRLVGDHADGLAIEARKSDHEITGKVFLNLEVVSIIYNSFDDPADVIWAI